MNSILKKTHPLSHIQRAHIQSKWAERNLVRDGDYVILQTMNIGDGWIVVECVTKEDYDLQTNTHI